MQDLKRGIVVLKLTPEKLKLTAEQYPVGYDDRDIFSFHDLRSESIEAVRY